MSKHKPHLICAIHHQLQMTDTTCMSENQKNIFLFLLCCTLSFLITVPETRSALLTLKNLEKRSVLAAIDYSSGSRKYRIVKLRVGSDLVLEIYAEDQTLVQHFKLPQSRDAHFNTPLQLSNLFTANLDEDATDEVVAPLIDDNLVSHFSILKYDPESLRFEHFLTSEL